MEGTLPRWFEADQVFCNDGNWYFGSIETLHVGPYENRESADAKSKQVTAALVNMKNDGERLRYVRKMLHEEWEAIKKKADSAVTTLVEEIDLTAPASQVRAGESNKNWYRSERFFQVDGVWFFATREGIDVGPFDSEADAKKHERHLISLLIKARTPEDAQRTIYKYKHRPATHTKIEFVPRWQFSGMR